MIKLRFTTLDGIRKTKRFKTLAGARKAAHDWVGKNAELGSYYAISADGVVKVTTEGCTLAELFGPETVPPAKADDYFKIKVGGDYIAKTFQYREDAFQYTYECGDFTYTDDAGVVRTLTFDIEHWRTGADGQPQRIEPPAPQSDAIDPDEIPF